MPAELVRRAQATEKTAARFRSKPFSWDRSATCLHMVRFHLRNMGHPAPTVPRFRSPLAAKRALAATGHADLAALLDSLLPRIAPAAMLIGDIALMEGGGMFDAIVINAGTTLFGYHDDFLDRGIMNIVAEGDRPFLGAWRL